MPDLRFGLSQGRSRPGIAVRYRDLALWLPYVLAALTAYGIIAGIVYVVWETW